MLSLKDYDISARYGFIPDGPLVDTLSEYYSPWELVISDLPRLVTTRKIRNVIDNLPILSMDRLLHESEWQRSYTILSFLSNAYIWGGDLPKEILPASLSIPLIDASDHFGLPPVLTYTALCLWNHNVGPGQDELDSLSTRMTFTGSVDESWFYLVSVIIEARGGIMVSLLLECLDAANDGEVLLVIERLERTSAILVELKTLLLRVYEKCRPRIFYDEFRPFLAGSKGTEALRRGVLLEDRNGSRFHGQYSGGSAGQSSLFQFLDITLGTRNARGLDDGFFKMIRRYMPKGHRRFLEDVAKQPNLHDFIYNHPHQGLGLAYDCTLTGLKAFREAHIQVVTRYIILPARASKQDGDLKGTAGSAIIPFLKQARDETLAQEAENLAGTSEKDQ